jgi:molecular chaperone GrpE
MSDHQKSRPINIPIESDDAPDIAQLDDDVFEIDGDAMDLDEEALEQELQEVAEAFEASAENLEPTSMEPSTADENETVQPAFSRDAVFDLMQELRQKSEQITRLTDEKNDLFDKLLRKQAEFENFRRRSEREMLEAFGRARAEVLGDFLPVLDNFMLALLHADTSGADAIHEGVQLINKQLVDTMSRLGLEPIDAEGSAFDPELHEAVATEPREDVPDHTVVAVFQRGYRLGDRLLRPARVKVAVQPA